MSKSDVGSNWYRTPLYYDVIYQTITPRESAFLAAAWARFSPARTRRVLEPACGSGRLLEALGRRGFELRGFDGEEAMVDFARERLRRAGVRAKLEVGRMEAFRVRPRVEMAFCTVSTFKYLLRERDARSHLECIADALVPGGIYVLGFHLTDYADRSEDRERWRGKLDGLRVTCNVDSAPPDRWRRRERLTSRLVAHDHGEVVRSLTRWQFRTYDVRQFERLLASVPALEQVATYDFDYDIERPRPMGVTRLDTVAILQKRGGR